MKLSGSILLALGFLISSFAMAEPAFKTEYFYQTPADKNQVSPELEYRHVTAQFTNSAINDVTADFVPLYLRYERGLNDMFSMGARLGYMLSGKIVSPTGRSVPTKGMSDLDLFVKGQYGLTSNMNFNFGLDLFYSVGNAHEKYDANGSQTEDTFQTGGVWTRPYVGVAFTNGQIIVGSKLYTEMNLKNRKLDNTIGSTKYSGESTGGLTTEISIFVEKELVTPNLNGTFGADLSYSGQTTTKDTINGSTASYTGANLLGVGIYGVINVNESLSLLGQLNGESVMNKPEGFKSITQGTMFFAARFTF